MDEETVKWPAKGTELKFEARSPHFRLSAVETLKAGSYKLITSYQNPGTRQRRRKGRWKLGNHQTRVCLQEE